MLPDPALPPLPAYRQVAEMLMREIAAGRLVEGARLPPEREMAASLGIAVGTLRRALEELTGKGMLERRQGSGNYIRTGRLREHFYAMFRLELPEGGGLPGAEVLSAEAMAKPAELPGFGASDRATRIRRIRTLDGIRVAAEEVWLDATQGTVRAEELGPSLYDHYRQRLGFWISAAEDRVGCAPLPGWAAGIGLAPGEPAGFVERLSWASGPRPVEFSRTWFNPARCVYTQRMR